MAALLLAVIVLLSVVVPYVYRYGHVSYVVTDHSSIPQLSFLAGGVAHLNVLK